MQLDTQSPAILLIEMDEMTLEIYQRELSKSFTVFAVTELSRVFEILTNRDIQAIIIEPEIQGGQGWELIPSINSTFPDRHHPVIVCSTRDAQNEGLGGEVKKYLTKPVLPRRLRVVSLEVLKSKKISRKIS